MKAVLPKRPKGISTKPASVVSLNSISVTKSCTARRKKASSTSAQGEEQAGDLDEVLEEGDEAHEIGGGFEKRPPGIEAGLRHPAGAQEIGGREAGAGGQEPQPRETVEDDGREAVPVGDQPGEDADGRGSFSRGGR